MPTTYESRIVAAPVADVWRAITDVQQASRWNQAWQRVEYLSSQWQGEGTTFRAYNEQGIGHNFRIAQWTPMEYVTFVPVEDDDPEDDRPYLLTLESQAFHLKPAGDDHTDVTLFASATGHGLRGWFAARFVWPSYQRQGLRLALDNLAALFEPPEDEGEPEKTDP